MCKNIYQDFNWEELKFKIVNGCPAERNETLVIIRNAVIGSNKQKGALIRHGLLPFILTVVGEECNQKLRLNALTIIGSVAKGSPGQVKILLENYDIPFVLLKEVTEKNNNQTCIEICLTTIRSLFEHPSATADWLFNDCSILSDFMNLALTSTSRKVLLCTTSLLISICQNHDQQMRLLQVGTLRVLTRMIYNGNEEIQFSALCALSSMCFANRSISDNVCVSSYHGRSLPDVLNSLMARFLTPQIQLAAARCLTYIYRSGTLLASDIRISEKTLSCLIRLSAGQFNSNLKAPASEILAYLLEVDLELQNLAAISSHLLRSLLDYLREYNPILKQSALNCLSSLSANDESIRKTICNTIAEMEVSFDNTNVQVGIASLMCLHSLSRSVHQLRTSFQDHTIWKPLLQILTNKPSTDILILVISIICNMLLDFSPSKPFLTNFGILQKLCLLVEEKPQLLRLNCVWALMNMSYQADEQTKSDIIRELGTKRIINLMCDSDQRIVIKTFGLLRNLLKKPEHIRLICNTNTSEIMNTLTVILISNNSVEIVEQVLCILGNIASDDLCRNFMINNDDILLQIGKYLAHSNRKLNASSLFTLKSILNGHLSEDNYCRLENSNIFIYTDELYKKFVKKDEFANDFILKTLREMIIQYKSHISKI